MGTGVLLTPPICQFFNNAGQVAANGSVLTQVGGINTATYQDINLTTPLANPIPLNSRGEVSTVAGASTQCFLTPNTVYVFTLFDGPNGTGNQLWQATYVNGVQFTLTQAAVGAALYPISTAETAAGLTAGNINTVYPPLGTAGFDTRRYVGMDPTGTTTSDGGMTNLLAVAVQIATATGTPFAPQMAPSGLYKFNNQIVVRSDVNLGLDLFGSYMLYTGASLSNDDASGAFIRFSTSDHSFGGCFSTVPEAFVDAGLLAGFCIRSAGNHNTGFRHHSLHIKNANIDCIYAGSVSGKITAITQATNAVITINAQTTTNPFAEANTGTAISINGVGGTLGPQINGTNGQITGTGGSQGSWTLTTNINTSAMNAYTSGGLVSGQQGCVSINWDHIDAFRAGNFGTSNIVAVCGRFVMNFDFNQNVGQITLKDFNGDNGVTGFIAVQGRNNFAGFDTTFDNCRFENWFSGALFTGTISGTTLTVTGTVNPANGIAIGTPNAPAYIDGNGITPGTGIIGGPGTGGAGTYTVNISQTVATSGTIRQPIIAILTNYAVAGPAGTITIRSCKMADSSAAGDQAADFVHNISNVAARAPILFRNPLASSAIQYLYRDENDHTKDLSYDAKLVNGPAFLLNPGASSSYVERLPLGTALNGTAISNISGITQAASAVITLSSSAVNNPCQVGQPVQIGLLSAVTGMTQINGQIATISATGGSSGAWTITVPINSSGYGAYVSGGNISFIPLVGQYVYDSANNRLIVYNGSTQVYAPLGGSGLLGAAATQNGVPTDAGKIIDNNNNASFTYNLPTLASVNIGWTVTLHCTAIGIITATAASADGIGSKTAGSSYASANSQGNAAQFIAARNRWIVATQFGTWS